MKCIYCGEEFELKYTRGNALKRKNCYKEECEKKRLKENRDRFKAKMKDIEIEEQKEIEIEIEPNGIDIIEEEPKFETKKVQELEVTINEIDYKDLLDIACMLDQCLIRLREKRAESQQKEQYYSNRQQDLLHKLEAFDFKTIADKISFLNDLKTTRQYRRVCKNRHGLIDKMLNDLTGTPNNKKKVEADIEKYKKPLYRNRV